MANRYGNTMDYSNDGGGVAFQSPGGGDNAYQSQSSPAGKARPATEEQTLIPVTIRMILNSTDGMLEDGREPYNVKLVAAIRSVTPSSTAFNYEVEDGTGLFEVKEWLDEGGPLAKQQMREEAAREHQYVRIIGKMQVYDGKPSIVAYSVKKLSSSNEITHHFLEVVHSVEKYKKSGQIVGSPSLNVNGGMAMNGMNMGGFNNGSMPTTSTPLALDTNMGVDALKDDILQFLIGSQDGDGKDVREFIGIVQGKYPDQKIREMFEFLSQEGLIYSTKDEFHYATAD